MQTFIMAVMYVSAAQGFAPRSYYTAAPAYKAMCRTLTPFIANLIWLPIGLLVGVICLVTGRAK